MTRVFFFDEQQHGTHIIIVHVYIRTTIKDGTRKCSFGECADN